jgi:RimJ/RimL family protein N-acetyltransferase
MPEIPLPDPPLADQTVALRPYRADDADAIVAALQDPEIPRWTVIPSPYTDCDAREFLSRVERDRLAGFELALAIADPGDDRLLGGCGLVYVDWRNLKAEIGYWVAREARRRSVGSAATRLLSRWALSDLGLKRLELLANPANEPSQRLAERAGFKREGIVRSYRVRKGSREDYVMYSLLPEDL